MKALIPAAGYGTRLYPLTENTPKALLEVKNKPILQYILQKVFEIDAVDEIFIISNDKFFKNFEKWVKDFTLNFRPDKKISVLNDGTSSEDDRLGSIGDIYFAIKEASIDDDVLVVNSDNLFEFSLLEMTEFFKKKDAPVVGLHDVESKERAKLYGVIETDSEKKIIELIEKPDTPFSTLVSMGIYFFPKSSLPFFNEYMEASDKVDKTGYFLEWLIKKTDVFGFEFPDEEWFDIGSKESLEEAEERFNLKDD